MRTETKARRMAAIMADVTTHTAQVVGGWPPDIDSTSIPGFVVVASAEYEDRPKVAVFSHQELAAWYDTYRAARKQLGRDEAYYETYPSQK
jgi:hypothetical protein